MDHEQRETANRLFAQATALLEDAIAVAVAGQAPRLTMPKCRTAAMQLQAVVSDVGALATAALVLTQGRDSPKRR